MSKKKRTMLVGEHLLVEFFYHVYISKKGAQVTMNVCLFNFYKLNYYAKICAHGR